MSDVFISYSRLDKEFVGNLRELLVERDQDVWIDWEDIPPSQSWWDEIKKGIARANNVVIVLSPHSMSSPICQMEIEYARQLRKRIIPVLYVNYERDDATKAIRRRLAAPEETSTRAIWENRHVEALFDANDSELKHINFFMFKPDADFKTRFEELFEVIRTDYAHKEQHTSIQLQAVEWDKRERDQSFLLLDTELKQAQDWLASANGKEPAPTELQVAYIEASAKRTRQLHNIQRASIIGSVVAALALIFAVVATSIGIQANTAAAAANEQATAADMLLTGVAPTLTQVGIDIAAAATSQRQLIDAQRQLIDAQGTLEILPLTVTAIVSDAQNLELTRVALGNRLGSLEGYASIIGAEYRENQNNSEYCPAFTLQLLELDRSIDVCSSMGRNEICKARGNTTLVSPEGTLLNFESGDTYDFTEFSSLTFAPIAADEVSSMGIVVAEITPVSWPGLLLGQVVTVIIVGGLGTIPPRFIVPTAGYREILCTGILDKVEFQVGETVYTFSINGSTILLTHN